MMKMALGLVLVMSAVGCHAQVRVQAKTETPPPPPPKAEEPKPEPQPQAGEQIALPDQIEFELDQARIKQTPKTLETLDKLAELMKSHANVTKLRIEGHTDNTGNPKHNDKLSKARADAVAKWLAQHEIDEKRLVTVGFGSRKPLKPNDTEANRALNRRTEYYFEEVDGKKVDGDASKKFEEPAKPQKVAAGTTTGGKGANGALVRNDDCG
jgi:outer membrane protein OmpA-like peptidoglycan-associated protein